jgi:hypothetical protein
MSRGDGLIEAPLSGYAFDLAVFEAPRDRGGQSGMVAAGGFEPPTKGL